MKAALFLSALMLVGAATGSAAQVPLPALESRVTDTAGVLTAGQRATLEQKLADFEARNDAAGRVLYTVLGTGRRGSYILFLGTSQADFTRHRALYKQWYDSLTLY